MKHLPAAGLELSFQAELENWAEGMDYCAIAVPSKITEVLGTRAPVPVMARINDSPAFPVSLFPVGGGQHYIRVKAKVRREAGVKVGDRIEVFFTVLDRSKVDIPEDLKHALRSNKVEEGFKSLPPGKQNFIVRRVNEAARPQTRAKRIEDALSAAKSAA